MPAPGRFLASARLIAILTFGSRVLGLARECVFSYFLSTSGPLSAFRIAFMLPNLARRLFGEGALSSALIPILSRDLHERGEDSARDLVGTLLTWQILVLSVGVAAIEGVLAVWHLIHPDLAIELTMVLMPYMVLICAVAVAGGALNVRNHFAAPAAVPMLLNIAIIGAVWIGAKGLGLREEGLVRVAAVGVLAAGAGQLVAVLWAMRMAGFYPRFGGDWRDPRIRALLLMMAPMVVGMSAQQINALMDYVIGYLFIVGDKGRMGPAILGYAQYIYQLPLGVFGIALATAIFPDLAARAATDERRGLAAVLGDGVRLSVFVALPSSVGLMLIAKPLVAALYQRGAFDAEDTARVAGALVFYSAGLAAYFVQHLLVRAFYSLQESRIPARVAGFVVMLNFAMNVALVFPLQERGLALATAVTAAIQIVWLWVLLRRQLPELPQGRVLRSGGLAALASVGMGTAVLLTDRVVLPMLPWASHAIVRLIILVSVGAVAYGGLAWLLGIEELALLLHRGEKRADQG